MSYLIGMVCFILAIFSFFIDRKIYNPAVLFNFWWGITIFVSGFGFFGIQIPEFETYFMYLVAILAFNLPVLLIRTRNTKEKVPNEIEQSYNVFFTKNVTNFISIISLFNLFLLIQRSLRVVSLLLSGTSYEIIRYLYYNSDQIVTGQYGMLITNVIITPITMFGGIIFALLLFYSRKNIYIMILSIMNVLLYSFSSGSRSIVMFLGISVVVSYILNYKVVKIKSKFSLYVIVASLIGVLIYITINRSDNVNQLSDILQTIVVYFTGAFVYFEKMLPVVEMDNTFFLGGSFFGGVIDIFILVMKLFGSNIEQISSIISEYNQEYVIIGSGIPFNAFTTMLYPFVYDFGKIGVLIQPFFFGLLARTFYVKLERNRTIMYKGIYIIIVMIIYESVMRWMGLFAHVWIMILLFYICNFIAKKSNY